MDIFWSVMKYLLFIGALLIVLIVPNIWNMRRLQAAARNPEIEAEYLRAGCEVSTSLANGRQVISGSLHGTPFELTVGTGSRSALQTTSVSVPSDLSGGFAATLEGSRDLSGRDLIESMFPDAKAREAVRTLFRLGFNPVVLRGGKLTAIRGGKAEVLHPDALRAVVEQLAMIRATAGVQAIPTWLAPSKSTIVISFASMVFLPVGMFLFAAGRAHGTATILKVWPEIAAAYLALATLAVLLLRGRPLATGEIGFVVFVALPGLFLGGMGVAMMAS